MPVVNPWWGLLKLSQMLEAYPTQDTLTDDVLLDLFEQFSRTYLRDALAFLLIEANGTLIHHIEKREVGFDYNTDTWCQEYVTYLNHLDYALGHEFFVIAKTLPEKRRIIARIFPHLNKTIFVVVERNPGLYSV